MPAFDERSLSSLVEFDNADSLSELLVELNDTTIRHDKYSYNENAGGIGQAPAQDNLCDATRLTTLQNRNQQLQRALALASVQHSKEISSMKRTIQKLEQQVAELKAERKETETK